MTCSSCRYVVSSARYVWSDQVEPLFDWLIVRDMTCCRLLSAWIPGIASCALLQVQRLFQLLLTGIGETFWSEECDLELLFADDMCTLSPTVKECNAISISGSLRH